MIFAIFMLSSCGGGPIAVDRAALRADAREGAGLVIYRIVAFAPYNGPAMYWFPVAARKKRLSGHGLTVVFPRDAFYRDGKRALNDRGGESSRAPLLERPNS
jgi:hypothetical protein